MAVASLPPMHNAATPRFRLRAFSACRSVTINGAPVAPIARAYRFAIKAGVGRCLRFCETDPPRRGLLLYSETTAKLLKMLGAFLGIFSDGRRSH